MHRDNKENCKITFSKGDTHLTHHEGFEDLEVLSDAEIDAVAEQIEAFFKGLLGAFVLALLSFATPANASIPDADGIRALMGEARGESYVCQVATAEAIRNRGTLKGVYGFKAQFNEPAWVWKRAEKAWKESAGTNYTNGATFWENTKAFGVPYWAKSMEQTAVVGSHTFWKKRGAK
jgi:hypothetical protein